MRVHERAAINHGAGVLITRERGVKNRGERGKRRRGKETAITFLSEKFLLKRIVQGACESSNIYKHFKSISDIKFKLRGENVDC